MFQLRINHRHSSPNSLIRSDLNNIQPGRSPSPNAPSYACSSMSKVILAYKNFAANRNISHIGLGVSAINTAKVLRSDGVPTEVWPLVSPTDLLERLPESGTTHVVISAPWIPSADLQRLCNRFPDVTFAMNCHSNVGFLQADANGVRLLREAIELEMGNYNFHVAGNSRKFCRWVTASYGVPCAYLPNLYYLAPNRKATRPLWRAGVLRIGAFGATRPLKNFISAAGAALEISRDLKADLELWVSAGRTEGGGDTILRAARALFQGMPNAKLVENGWQSWPQFRQTVGHMHLLLQPSYTESFNMVTADGIAEGVASAVSSAIDWVPEYWQAAGDDVWEIARIGRQLLGDPQAIEDGLESLANHNTNGLSSWHKYLQQGFSI